MSFDAEGWSDTWEQESEAVFIEFWAIVRPSAPSSSPVSEPLHAFIATLDLRHWIGPDRDRWGPWERIHRSEHGSLVAGVKAANAAAKRGWSLRRGPAS